MKKIKTKYDVIIFDLDGTLLDTSSGIIYAVGKTLDKMNLPSVSYSIAQRFIGPPLKKSFMQLCGMTEYAAKNATDIFRFIYRNESMFIAGLYPDVKIYLEQLKAIGIRMCVATNKNEELAMEILEYFDIAKFFSAICGSNDTKQLDKKDIINICLDKLKIESKKEVLMVGDSKFDAIGASECNIDFLAALYGFDFKTKLDTKKYCSVGYVKSFADIFKFVVC